MRAIRRISGVAKAFLVTLVVSTAADGQSLPLPGQRVAPSAFEANAFQRLIEGMRSAEISAFIRDDPAAPQVAPLLREVSRRVAREGGLAEIGGPRKLVVPKALADAAAAPGADTKFLSSLEERDAASAIVAEARRIEDRAQAKAYADHLATLPPKERAALAEKVDREIVQAQRDVMKTVPARARQRFFEMFEPKPYVDESGEIAVRFAPTKATEDLQRLQALGTGVSWDHEGDPRRFKIYSPPATAEESVAWWLMYGETQPKDTYRQTAAPGIEATGDEMLFIPTGTFMRGLGTALTWSQFARLGAKEIAQNIATQMVTETAARFHPALGTSISIAPIAHALVGRRLIAGARAWASRPGSCDPPPASPGGLPSNPAPKSPSSGAARHEPQASAPRPTIRDRAEKLRSMFELTKRMKRDSRAPIERRVPQRGAKSVDGAGGMTDAEAVRVARAREQAELDALAADAYDVSDIDDVMKIAAGTEHEGRIRQALSQKLADDAAQLESLHWGKEQARKDLEARAKAVGMAPEVLDAHINAKAVARAAREKMLDSLVHDDPRFGGGKHVGSRDPQADSTVRDSKDKTSGQYKSDYSYRRGTKLRDLERKAIVEGTRAPLTKNVTEYYVYDAPEIVGFSNGEPTKTIVVEVTGRFVHSYPVSSKFGDARIAGKE